MRASNMPSKAGITSGDGAEIFHLDPAAITKRVANQFACAGSANGGDAQCAAKTLEVIRRNDFSANDAFADFARIDVHECPHIYLLSLQLARKIFPDGSRSPHDCAIFCAQ